MVLDPQRWMELRRFRGLFESGAMSLSEIARETGLNRRTVRKYLTAQAPISPPRRSSTGHARGRMVDDVAPLIDAMLRSEILIKGAVVHERLVAEYGFTGNYQRVKLYMQEARPRVAEELGISPCELAGLHRRTSLDDMVRQLKAAETAGRLNSKLRTYLRPGVLVVDEVGYQPLERAEANLVFQVISKRYEKGSIILTSNKTFSEWGQVFGDEVLATAILDRLLHHCDVVSINGPSYRLKNRLAAIERDNAA